MLLLYREGAAKLLFCVITGFWLLGFYFGERRARVGQRRIRSKVVDLTAWRLSALIVGLRSIDLIQIQTFEALPGRHGGSVVREQAALLRSVRRHDTRLRLQLAVPLLLRLNFDGLREGALAGALILTVQKPRYVGTVFVNVEHVLVMLLHVVCSIVCFYVQFVNRVGRLHHCDALQH